MYAYTVPAAEAGDQQVDFDMGKFSSIDRDFDYWRKFNHLHGWMHRLYIQKGGKSSDFNCDTLRLTLADINQLEADLNAKTAGTRDNLAATAGVLLRRGCLVRGGRAGAARLHCAQQASD